MQIFLNELKPNSTVQSTYLCKKKILKKTKEDKSYLELTLSDKSGKIEARVWDNAEDLNTLFNEGDVVRVSASSVLFKNDIQLKVDNIAKAAIDEYKYQDLVRSVPNPDGILENIEKLLSGIKNEWILRLKDSFIDDKIFMERFIASPGAKSWHNAYLGGLMEHTYEVMYIVDKVHNLYPSADQDILIFGAFIHDMGKIFELDATSFEYTVEGGLVGHVAIGYKMLSQKIAEIEDFPKDLALLLEHIVLSHHGEYEQQSPVLPKTLEATIIYQTDELVSQANAVKEIEDTQKSVPGQIWSNFVSIKNRKYLLKK